MTSPSPCPQCHSPATLFDKGTLTPRQFFSSNHAYKIAESEHKQRLPLYRCTACGHGFTPLNVSPSYITTWYQNNPPDLTFIGNEVARRRTAQVVLERVERFIPQRGKLLDVGAGPGLFVSEASRRGWVATGLELSSWAIKHAQEEYGVTMKQGQAENLQDFEPNSFDVVTMFDVIEHVADPRTLVQAATAVLRPGGFLVLTTPRFDSFLSLVMGRRWYCIFPAHIQYFTRRSLYSLLTSLGLNVRGDRAHTRYLSSHYVWQRLKAFVGNSTLSAQAGPDNSPIIPINFRDEFEVYAQKDEAERV